MTDVLYYTYMVSTGQKIKVLLLVTQGVWGGAQKYVYDLAKRLPADFDITVASGSTDGELVRHCLKSGIAYRTIRHLKRPISNPIHDVLAVYEIAKLVREEKFQIVHSNSSKAGVVGSIGGRLGGARTVYTVHGLVLNEPLSPLFFAVYWAAEKFASLFRNLTIAVSEADREATLVRHLAAPETVTVIRNGIDLGRAFLTKPEAKKKLGLLLGQSVPEKSPVIGTIADFYATKDYPTLITAMEQVFQMHPECRLVAFGRGDSTSVRREISKSKHQDSFHIIENRNDAAEFLPAFDVFVLASIKEGMPYTIMEAAAAGSIILATSVGGIPEIIHNDVNGKLVPPANPPALAEALLYLLSRPQLAARYGPAAKASVSDLSLQKTIDQTAAVYHRLAVTK